MKRLCFKLPYYKVRCTLIQVEGAEDLCKIQRDAFFRKLPIEDKEKVIRYIENGFHDGGDTWRNLDHRAIYVLFYPMTCEEERAEIYSHEKRHIEDRVLEYFGVDDIESAGLLAGFLGRQFYKFERL